MNNFPPNICKDLAKLIPISVLNEITCFSFYDNHPQDSKSIDVIFCTKRGEIQEIYKREIISSFMIENAGLLSEIKLFRNDKCKLYYFVKTSDDLLIFSRNDKILLLHRINNIASYDIEDPECKGQAYLKILRRDDAVPLIFNENNEKLLEKMFNPNNINCKESVPLLTSLERKLTEAHYCIKFNESKYAECLNLCQEAAFHLYKKTCTSSKPSNFKFDAKEISDLLQIETEPPQVRLCNKKIAIFLNIKNLNSFSIENVCVIIHCSAKKSFIYKTKLFQEIPESPYWSEYEVQVVNANQAMSIVAVIELEEVQYCISSNSRIELDIVLAYVKENKSYLLPFEKVVISARDLMGEDFDILSSASCDSRKVMLCILSTSEKTQLCMRCLSNSSENTVTPSEIFCEYLKMDILSDLQNVAVHKLSPYHILHGVMVVFLPVADHTINVIVYSRFPSQVRALVNYINDLVPYRLVITTNNYKLTSLDNTLSKYDEIMEDSTFVDIRNPNLKILGKSVLKQTSITKEYLDNCMIKMSESKNIQIQEKVGCQIDLVSQGLLKYIEFRDKILNEIENDLQSDVPKSANEDIECMIIDS